MTRPNPILPARAPPSAISSHFLVATSKAGRGSGVDGNTPPTPTLRGTPAAVAALKALDETLKRGVKHDPRHAAEVQGFLRGDALSAETAGAPGTVGDGSGGGPWGLPLLLAALDSASLPFSARGDGAEKSTTGGDGCNGVHRSPETGSGLSQGALSAVISSVRTCTRAAAAGDQEALLSSLFSRILPPPAAGGGGGGGGGGDPNAAAESGLEDAGVRTTMEKHAALLPALAAVMGAVSLDSVALGPGGAAAAAVPALLSASLAEGSTGLVKTGESGAGATARESSGEGHGGSGAGGGGGGGGNGGALSAPCCQCLAAVLNKLARGPELDSAVALVVEALQRVFAGEGGGGDEGAMDVEGATGGDEGCGEEVGPVQCLAWTVKAVAMRGGLPGAFSALLDLLCGLLTTVRGLGRRFLSFWRSLFWCVLGGCACAGRGLIVVRACCLTAVARRDDIKECRDFGTMTPTRALVCMLPTGPARRLPP